MVYGKPYRYLLNRIASAMGIKSYSHDVFYTNNSNPSYCASIVFPLLVFESFQRDNPAQFFYDALESLCRKKIVDLFKIQLTSGAIEIEWFYRFEILNEAISKAPTSTNKTNIDVSIIKSPYKNFIIDLNEQLDLVNTSLLKPERHPFEFEAHNSINKNGAKLIRIFLGFKPFMLSFAICLPPPWISFKNNVKWSRALDQQISAIKTKKDEVRDHSKWLEHFKRVEDFRNAEKAHSLGLPLNTFRLE